MQKLYNKELEEIDSYQDVYETRFELVRGIIILVHEHWLKDVFGEYWADFSNPNENVLTCINERKRVLRLHGSCFNNYVATSFQSSLARLNSTNSRLKRRLNENENI